MGEWGAYVIRVTGTYLVYRLALAEGVGVSALVFGNKSNYKKGMRTYRGMFPFP